RGIDALGGAGRPSVFHAGRLFRDLNQRHGAGGEVRIDPRAGRVAVDVDNTRLQQEPVTDRGRPLPRGEPPGIDVVDVENGFGRFVRAQPPRAVTDARVIVRECDFVPRRGLPGDPRIHVPNRIFGRRGVAAEV